jgi:SAM-dependent methyltransferase
MLSPMSDGWAATFRATDAMEFYDSVMVPRMFGPLAEVLLDRLAVAPGERVLDVACGPGSVARIAARRVGPDGHVTGADISEAMLAVARAKPPVPDGAPITWVETPACPLGGIESGAFDVVTCQQGLQFFPDRAGALAEMRRALAPGGRVGIAVWSSIDQSPLFAALASALGDVLGEEVADRYRSGPWGLTDPDVLASLLEGAGLAEVQVVPHTLEVTWDGGLAQVLELLHVAAVADDVAALSEAGKAELVAAAERRSGMQDGVVRAPMTTLLGLGRATAAP